MSHSSLARSSSSLAAVRKPCRRCKATTLVPRWSAEFPSVLDRTLKLYDIASAVEAALLAPGHDTLLAAAACVLLVLAEKCAEHLLDRAETAAAIDSAAERSSPARRPSADIPWTR